MIYKDIFLTTLKYSDILPIVTSILVHAASAGIQKQEDGESHKHTSFKQWLYRSRLNLIALVLVKYLGKYLRDVTIRVAMQTVDLHNRFLSRLLLRLYSMPQFRGNADSRLI